MSTGSGDKEENISLGRRLRRLRGAASQLKFAAHVGISDATLSRYEKDQTPVPADVLARICEVTGARADWLLFGTGPMLRETEEPPEPTSRPQRQTIGGMLYRDVPLADKDKDEGGYLTLPDVDDDDVFALVITSTAMSPKLNPGDIIFVSPKRRDNPLYPIVAAEIGTDELVVRYHRREGDRVILWGDNPGVQPIELPESEVRILGRVVKGILGLGG